MRREVEQIKERLSIEDVIASYVTLTRVGANFRAKCPFHNEKTPSFYVSPDRGSYYCFGCGAKGDIFSFVEQFEGLDFLGSLKLLAARAGVELTHERKPDDEKEALYAIMEDATVFFVATLAKHPEITEYLKARGLTEKTIHEFRIGYIPNEWRMLHTYLKEKKWSDVLIEKAGLARKTEKAAPSGGQGYYDRFRGRVMFPLNDSSGRVIAFSGRIIVEDPNAPKYLNSPETPLFDKSSVLYGLDKAKNDIRKRGFAILVEGQFDLILSHQHGFTNTIATSGTALSDAVLSDDARVTNLGLLKRLTNNLMLGFDGDKAGFAAALRAAKIALSLGMDVKVAKLPKGVDPADALSKDVAIWTLALKEAEHVILFHTNVLRDRYPDDRIFGRMVVTEVLPLVAELGSEVERMHFLHLLAGRTGISENALMADFTAIKGKEIRHTEGVVEISHKRILEKDQIEKLFGILFWQEEIAAPMIDPAQLRRDIQNIFMNETAEMETTLRARKDELIFEAEMIYQKMETIPDHVRELLGRIRLRYTEALCEKLRHQIKEFESKGQDTKELLEKYHEHTQIIESIKKSLLEEDL